MDRDVCSLACDSTVLSVCLWVCVCTPTPCHLAFSFQKSIRQSIQCSGAGEGGGIAGLLVPVGPDQFIFQPLVALTISIKSLQKSVFL